jgi:hypothetical protein
VKAITDVPVPQENAHLAQGDGASSQADEAPFPTVGMLGQGKLLRQGLDHMLDLYGVVLCHELPNQPGEKRERSCGTGGPGLRKGDDLFRKRNWVAASQGRSSQFC